MLFRKLHNSARVFKNKVAAEAYKIENDKVRKLIRVATICQQKLHSQKTILIENKIFLI